MSMDFRIPNPLEFNDPFLLQRRRWKRSERRRIRRGAQGTLGHFARGGSENGHLPNRLAGLSSSMSHMEAHSSLERAVVAKFRPRVSVAGGLTVQRSRADPAVGVQAREKSFHHLLHRSFSLPVACSTLELGSTGAAMQEGSFSGSESAFDSKSDSSSLSLSFSALQKFQPCPTVTIVDEGGVRAAQMNAAQEKNKLILAEDGESVANSGHNHKLASSLLSHSSLLPSSRHPAAPPPQSSTALSPSCQLLDFFGENLAFIDESSDTLSDHDRVALNEDRRRRPRKPKRRSMKRQFTHRRSPLQVRRPSSDLQPPSNPPTPPPPDSSPLDLPSSEIQTDSAPAL